MGGLTAQLGSEGFWDATEGIYQVRGPQVPATGFVDGDRGVIVVNPAPGGASLGIYRERRGNRAVTGVIFTHSRGDPAIDNDDDDDVPTLAPAGLSLLPPTIPITHTGQEETIDGVRVVSQLSADTEATVFFPGRKALWLAANPAGLSETIRLFGAETEVLFCPARRPIRGRSEIVRYLCAQRDAHAYLHDQTVRLLYKGHTDDEITELLQLPPALRKTWHGGPLEHHVKAIYQRHLGLPDGLWPHPPVDAARRYVRAFGGVENVVAEAQELIALGDLRYAAKLLHHAVFAPPCGEGVKELLAWVYERLAHAAEDPTWRQFYLNGARQLRHANTFTPLELGTAMASALPLERIFDALAIRVDAPAAWHDTITIDWIVDNGQYRTSLRHGVLIHHRGAGGEAPDVTLRVTKTQLLELLAAQGLDGIPAVLTRFLSRLDHDTSAVA